MPLLIRVMYGVPPTFVTILVALEFTFPLTVRAVQALEIQKNHYRRLFIICGYTSIIFRY